MAHRAQEREHCQYSGRDRAADGSFSPGVAAADAARRSHVQVSRGSYKYAPSAIEWTLVPMFAGRLNLDQAAPGLARPA